MKKANQRNIFRNNDSLSRKQSIQWREEKLSLWPEVAQWLKAEKISAVILREELRNASVLPSSTTQKLTEKVWLRSSPLWLREILRPCVQPEKGCLTVTEEEKLQYSLTILLWKLRERPSWLLNPSEMQKAIIQRKYNVSWNEEMTFYLSWYMIEERGKWYTQLYWLRS